RDADPAGTDPDHSFGLTQGLTLATLTLQPATFRYVHRLVDEDDWPGLSFADVPLRCLDLCDAGLAPPVDPVTMNLYTDLFALINLVVPADHDDLMAVDLDLIPLA